MPVIFNQVVRKQRADDDKKRKEQQSKDESWFDMMQRKRTGAQATPGTADSVADTSADTAADQSKHKTILPRFKLFLK